MQSGQQSLQTATIPLEDGTESLDNLPSTMILNLPSDLSLQDKVQVYGAVVSQKQQLVKTGEFIRITDNSEVRLNLSINMMCIDEINQLMDLYIKEL